ncbi:MAG: hypothetical protein HFH60_06145 [Lachnospiraceae bacterium]|nr:hypothetical protein [Lachnospiraceae bacterium]MCI9546251.1 hypothetical protein [Lachnospiraceae bacterium]
MKKEDEAYQAVLEEFTDMLLNSGNEEILQYMIKKVENMRQEAFMDGYQYAISILEESMVDKQ